MGLSDPKSIKCYVDVPPLTLRQATLLKALINKEARANGRDGASKEDIERIDKRTVSESRNQDITVIMDSDASDSDVVPIRARKRRNITSHSVQSSGSSSDSSLLPLRRLYRHSKNSVESSPSIDSYIPEFAHRKFCEKCQDPPAPIMKKRKRRRRYDEDDMSPEELGAWIQCKQCVVSTHFACATPGIRKLIHNRNPAMPKSHRPELKITSILTIDACHLCSARGGTLCLFCSEDILMRDKKPVKKPADSSPRSEASFHDLGSPSLRDKDTDNGNSLPKPAPEGPEQLITRSESKSGDDDKDSAKSDNDKQSDASYVDESEEDELESSFDTMFRCFKCNRAAHASCLNNEDKEELWKTNWLCPQCRNWNKRVDLILAWRPIEKENDSTSQDPPSFNDVTATAEYLVKWKETSYRNLIWVPHAYIISTEPYKLRAFLTQKMNHIFASANNSETGTPDVPEEEQDPDVISSKKIKDHILSLRPNPKAEEDIPKEWKTIDVILDVELKRRDHVVPFSSCRNLPQNSEDSLHMITSIYVKWKGLPYSESTWDLPFEPEEEGYDEYVKAYDRFFKARRVKVPRLTTSQLKELDRPKHQRFRPIESQPSYINKNATLKDFQIDGISWLYYNWCHQRNVILADEMGLGKTVQIISFLAVLYRQERTFPFLVVVPSSVVANWVREFAKWAPSDMRVVAIYGLEKSRRIQINYELLAPKRLGTNDRYLMTHVVITTYESVISESASINKAQRYEVMVVDEAQRLKAGDNGRLFSALSKLRVGQRVLLTGTPLNNNVGELFNLLHFLDPDEFDDPRELSKSYEVLDAEKVNEIQKALKPHFLRRTKAILEDIPPLIEIVVPVTMNPLQKRIYKTILSGSKEALESLFRASDSSKKVSKGVINNVLMELRKLLQHPYLVEDSLEDERVSSKEAHQRLVDASAKLSLLQKMLNQLRQNGHRVLIFSQFVINLDILETFLQGEKIQYARLDGRTPQADRQVLIDMYNKENSPLFVFLISTRAGGVGINLWSADTVIIYDVDFNPQQDLQAISRAHRIGQTKKVMVFKLMIKNSIEEKMVMVGKKKMVLDHLIIQRMEAVEDEPEDIESILAFGAKALFEEGGDKESKDDIVYTENDVRNLIERTETETASEEEKGKGDNRAYSYARIWEGEGLQQHDIQEDEGQKNDQNIEEERNFWKHIIEQQEKESEDKRKQQASAKSLIVNEKRKRTQRINYDDSLTFDFDDEKDKEEKEKDRKKKKAEQRQKDKDDEFKPVVDSESDASVTDRSDFAYAGEEDGIRIVQGDSTTQQQQQQQPKPKKRQKLGHSDDASKNQAASAALPPQQVSVPSGHSIPLPSVQPGTSAQIIHPTSHPIELSFQHQSPSVQQNYLNNTLDGMLRTMISSMSHPHEAQLRFKAHQALLIVNPELRATRIADVIRLMHHEMNMLIQNTKT